ncbi:MAG: hypothetical protein ACREOK_07310 [Gemmatimonadaceae bacterium]
MRRLTVAIGLFVTPVVAAAQFPARDTTSIPRDLATALIHHNFGVPPTIVVGELPDTSLAPLVPAGARVLGGIAYSTRRSPGQNNTAVLEVPETPDSAMILVESAAERHGWRPAPMTMDPGERGGFVVRSVPAYGGMMSTVFCRESAMLIASASQAGDKSLVRLMVNADGPGMCGRETRLRVRGIMSSEFLELPTLRPPPGARPMGGHGSSGSTGQREMSIQLDSRLTAAEMVGHFVPQLEEQEWKIASRVDQDDIAVATATKNADNGDTLHLVLLVNRFQSRNHHASVRVWNPAARDW